MKKTIKKEEILKKINDKRNIETLKRLTKK
mgnify:FL=1|jgi:hypothetical protein